MHFPDVYNFKKHLKLLLILSVFAFPFSLSAQSESDETEEKVEKPSNYQEWEAGLFLGVISMMGDLVSADKATSFTLKPAFGLSVYRNLSPTLALRGNLFYGKLGSDDADSDIASHRTRGFSSETPLTELSLMLQYEFLGNRRFGAGGKFKKTVSPYVFLGLAGAFGEAEVNFNGQENTPRAQQDIADASGSRIGIPIGLGLKFDITRKIFLGLEASVRPTFNDLLDGISTSANPDKNDWYGFGGVVVGFRLGEKDSDKDGIADIDDDCPTLAGEIGMGGCPDSDSDGVADKDDACPTEYGAKNLNGCPDSDGDGIADRNDDCPNTEGLRRFQGCPDSDGDDVIDKEDVCPNVAGLSQFSGCPDTDRDGVVDSEDKCPNDAGAAATGGCPDADGDGVLDADDNCPNQAGLSNMGGCPDSDGDGVSDDQDKCPTLAGGSASEGCPEIEAEDKKTLDAAMRNVRFETSSARLRTSSRAILEQVAEVVKRYPGYKLRISGYTDSVGNDFVNQTLSEKRARSCYNYLISKGVPAGIISYAGYGETNPIASNKTTDGRRLNRRVEFELVR